MCIRDRYSNADHVYDSVSRSHEGPSCPNTDPEPSGTAQHFSKKSKKDVSKKINVEEEALSPLSRLWTVCQEKDELLGVAFAKN